MLEIEENLERLEASATFAPPKKSRKRLYQGIVSATILLVTLLIGGGRFFFLRSHEETDDAYITGHPHQVSARIENVVQEVFIDDNDHVEKGQLLVKLDPRDYEIAVAKAQAKLSEALREADKDRIEISFADQSATAESTQAEGIIRAANADVEHERARIEEAQYQVEVARSEVEEADSQLKRAELDNNRFSRLEKRGVVTTQQMEHARRDFEVCKSAKQAKLTMVQQAVSRAHEAVSAEAAAEARLAEAIGKREKAYSAHVYKAVTAEKYRVALAEVDAARTEVENARLQLSYCNVYAPVSGRIGKRTVEVGHRIEPGQQLMDVIEDYVWVVANFKETQVRRFTPGQSAEIKVDSIPDKVFYGVVDSFSPGSGASFALLPPDNATGNFTKIVQRIPVKIRLEDFSVAGYKERLAVGLSAVVDVDLERRVSTDHLQHMRKLDRPDGKIWDGDGKGVQ